MGAMDANELRAAQAPLKDRYRQSGADALTPIVATGEGSGPAPSFSVRQTGSITQAGLHRAAGGDGADACSGDMLLEAVLACAGVTLRAVALASGLDLQSIQGRASATFDARGTLGVDRSVPVGIRVDAIRCNPTLLTSSSTMMYSSLTVLVRQRRSIPISRKRRG